MEINKLFQVLVVGGAILSGGSVPANGETGSPVSDETKALFESADAELKSIFCNAPGACVVDVDGKRKVKKGFYCCWGTRCD